MVSNVSFSGNVFLTGSTKEHQKVCEMVRLQKFADKLDSDIVVLDRDYYVDGTGKYTTLVVSTNETTGSNRWNKVVFDFAKMRKNYLQSHRQIH